MKNNNVEMNLEMFGSTWDEVLREGNSGGSKTEFTKLQNGITERRTFRKMGTLVSRS